MNERETELMKQIGQIIERLQEVQRDIAGTQQPASRFELETLQELGARYAELYGELQNWYAAKAAGTVHDDTTR